jgi:hypothetical protein
MRKFKVKKYYCLSYLKRLANQLHRLVVHLCPLLFPRHVPISWPACKPLSFSNMISDRHPPRVFRKVDSGVSFSTDDISCLDEPSSGQNLQQSDISLTNQSSSAAFEDILPSVTWQWDSEAHSRKRKLDETFKDTYRPSGKSRRTREWFFPLSSFKYILVVHGTTYACTRNCP